MMHGRIDQIIGIDITPVSASVVSQDGKRVWLSKSRFYGSERTFSPFVPSSRDMAVIFQHAYSLQQAEQLRRREISQPGEHVDEHAGN